MRLLIIEDNRPLAENLAEIFELEGYDVRFAVDGKSGLEAAAHGFDLALVDVRLPDTTGTALVPKLKGLSADSEVIVATANADLSTAIDAVQAGACAYLTKPVRTEELIVTVARAREKVELRRRERVLREALEASERRLRALVENVQAVIVTLDAELVIRFASRAAFDVLGYREVELRGRDIVETLATPQAQDRCRALLVDLDAHADALHEMDCVHKDGTLRRMVWRWRPGREGAREVVYGIGTDITNRLELERRARVAEKLALAGTLTAGLAHEVRNPLNAAGLQLLVLSRQLAKAPPALAAELKKPLDIVRAELSRLEGLLQEFLAFARPREYGRDPVDLARLIERLVALQSEAARVAKRRLETDLAPCAVRGDAGALEQVLLNVVQNALQASRAVVRVRATTVAGQVVIEVCDDGPPVPSEIMDRVFEPFFTTKSEGTGLGMSISHTIVSAHEGSISMRCDAAEGTVVTIRLPQA